MNTARKALATALFNYYSTKHFDNKNVNLRNLLLDVRSPEYLNEGHYSIKTVDKISFTYKSTRELVTST